MTSLIKINSAVFFHPLDLVMQNQFSIQAFKTTSAISISIKNVNMQENNTQNPYYVIVTSSFFSPS